MPGAGAFHGRNAKYRFGRQTDVAFDQQGNIFVSDGYFDARVVKYDKNGRFIKAVGTRGNGNLQFNTPHSIATDFQGNVYVGDRGNARVQVLDNDLNWKANYTNVGNPWAVCVSGGPGPKNPGKQYLYVSNSWPDSAPAAAAEFTGEVYKMELDGTIIGKFGRAGKAAGEFATIHQMDCRDPDVIYTAEINNWRSQKILLKPGSPMTRPIRVAAGGGPRPGARRSSRRPPAPDIAFDTNADLLQDADRHLRRRSRRRRREFEGADLRLHAHGPSVRDARRQPHVLARRIAALPVRSGRQVRARARPGRLRLQRRDRAARRSAGQRLDDRRGREPGREVRSRGPHRARARPKAGNDRGAPGAAGGGGGGRRRRAARRRAPAPARPARASTVRPTSRGIAPATSTSPTASAPTIASRSSTRTAASSSTGDRPAPGQGQFNGVKAIAIDAQGNVYVADAGNKRIQVFDAEGTFKSEFGNVGTPLAMCMTRGATQYLYISHAGDDDGMEDAAIYKVQLDGKVVGKFGSAGKLPKQFGLANSIDCRNENELLIGEMTNWRVQKVTLEAIA